MGIMDLGYEQGFVIFTAPDDDIGIDEAKQYCLVNELHPDMVRIVRQNKQILVKIK